MLTVVSIICLIYLLGKVMAEKIFLLRRSMLKIRTKKLPIWHELISAIMIVIKVIIVGLEVTVASPDFSKIELDFRDVPHDEPIHAINWDSLVNLISNATNELLFLTNLEDNLPDSPKQVPFEVDHLPRFVHYCASIMCQWSLDIWVLGRLFLNAFGESKKNQRIDEWLTFKVQLTS